MPEPLLIACLFATLLVPNTFSRETSYKHRAALDADGKYDVKWRFDGATISFEVAVATRGYVGFGFSPSGAMARSDLVIGGVSGGRPYLQDYFADASRMVHRDPQQSYRLEYAWENDTHTVLGFSRDLLTCDPNDKDITESTVRVIWAYHSEDVGPLGPMYHGVNRGRKSVRLLNPAKGTAVPDGTRFFDLRNSQVPVPSKDTTYWCQLFRFPEVQKKHHVIRIEPLIQKGHENLVHHILLYQCDRDLDEDDLGTGHECYHQNMPDSFQTCETVVFAWAIGGEGFTYPPHAGLSIGTSIDPFFVLMEIHYDNPALHQGRFLKNMTIFTFECHCTQECLQESLDHEMPSGIRVFAVLLHAHLAGRAIRTRHFRGQKELRPLAHDSEFDFNFQEFLALSEERLLLPGDHLITECKYNTKSRKQMTWGGLSTRDEMCLSYLLYYPRINLARCESLPEIKGQLKFIGVKEIQMPVRSWPFVIKSPKRYNNLSFTEAMDKFRWSKKRGEAFNEVVLQLKMNVRCSKRGQEEWSVMGEMQKTHFVLCSVAVFHNDNHFTFTLI
uniref:DOMON domain-containing protein n=1 Tax=Denticeps clupeoides TaxID=299321 RepID=A0AAY4CXG7_9TELE